MTLAAVKRHCRVHSVPHLLCQALRDRSKMLASAKLQPLQMMMEAMIESQGQRPEWLYGVIMSLLNDEQGSWEKIIQLCEQFVLGYTQSDYIV